MVPREHRSRYRRIMRFAVRHLLQFWWYEIALPALGLSRLADRTRTHRMQQLTRRFRPLAIDLGGLMIKVGQFMSSRLDVLPPEVTAELEGLQDEVPPAEIGAIHEQIERALGAPASTVFAEFDDNPLAAASLGQAHRAVLREPAPGIGQRRVVVKVQRPGIDQIVDIDLRALRTVGRWLSRVRAVSARADIPALVEEFATISHHEIDYLHEAASAEGFADRFAEIETVRVPAIDWERTTRTVLTMEDVTGIKVTDHDALTRAGVSPSDVAGVFARAMFEQVFVHGVFHADPHPGNLFVQVAAGGPSARDADPAWTLTFIDFGMMGEIGDPVRRALRRAIIAVTARDSAKLIAAVGDMGVLLPHADTGELERATAALFARFGGMGMAQLRRVDPQDFRDFGDDFAHVVRTMPFQFPESFLLLIRAMSLTSGVASALDPEFNAWDAVEPFAEELVREEGASSLGDLAGDAMTVVTTAARLPRRLDAVITRVEEGRVRVDLTAMERRMSSLQMLAKRILGGVLFGSLLVAAAIFRQSDAVISTVLLIVSLLPLGYTLWPGRKT